MSAVSAVSSGSVNEAFIVLIVLTGSHFPKSRGLDARQRGGTEGGEEDRGGGQEETGGGCWWGDIHSLLPTRGAAETPLLHVNFRHNIQVKLPLI